MALKHYDDFRTTQDIAAWWAGFRDLAPWDRVRAAVERVAAQRDYQIEHRQFGATDSLEFKVPGANKKVFSFHIAVRDVSLEEPLLSPWLPLRIETLRDNIGSKMNALVNRGAPSDFVDIFRVVNDGLISKDDCWSLWREKNPEGDLAAARGQVLTHLARLEQRRPLVSITSAEERAGVEELRRWYRDVMLSAGGEAP